MTGSITLPDPCREDREEELSWLFSLLPQSNPALWADFLQLLSRTGGDEAVAAPQWYMSRRCVFRQQGNMLCDGEGKSLARSFPFTPSADARSFMKLAASLLEGCGNGMGIVRIMDNFSEGDPQAPLQLRLLQVLCDQFRPGVKLLGPHCPLWINEGVTALLWHSLATADARLLLSTAAQGWMSGPQLHMAFLPSGFRFCLDYGQLAGMGCQEEPHRAFLQTWLTGEWEGSPARGQMSGDYLQGSPEELLGFTARDPLAQKRPELMNALIMALPGIPVPVSGVSPESDAVLKALTDLRHQNPAMDERASLRPVYGWNDHLLILRRELFGQIITCAFNLDAEPQTAWPDERPGFCTDLLTGEPMGGAAIELPPLGFCFLAEETQGGAIR